MCMQMMYTGVAGIFIGSLLVNFIIVVHYMLYIVIGEGS